MIDTIVMFVVMLCSFTVYTSNTQTLASYDSASNSLLAFNLLENHRLDFDLFRGGYFTALGGQYTFESAANGHLASTYPVGTAIVSFPVYAALYFARRGDFRATAINSPAFEPLRQKYEKVAAAAVAAVSVGLFFLCARQIARITQAAVATAVYALATSVWSIASQALWQHGPVNLFVLAMFFTLLRADRARASQGSIQWLVTAGVCAGFLTVIRPTAALFTIAGLLFVALALRARAFAFIVGLIIGAAPGVAWNAYFFHSLLGGYGGIVPMDSVYDWTPSHVLAAFGGLFVSPSRGIIVFSPILLFAVPGAARVWHRRAVDRAALLVVLLVFACAVLVAQYAVYAAWWAGYAYGPRYLCDTVGVAALLVLYAIVRHPTFSMRRQAAPASAATVFAVLFVYSVGVQFVGTNSGAAGSEWNAVPVSVNRDPERVWDIRDNQIERNVRAAYYRFFAWNIAASPDYERGLAAHVAAVAPMFAHVVKGESVEATASVRNDGRTAIYGYDTGVYVGQMRVRLRIVDALGQTTSEQYLYVRGSPASGESANATGVITMPPRAGRYVLECDPVLVGGPAMRNPSATFRTVLRVG